MEILILLLLLVLPDLIVYIAVTIFVFLLELIIALVTIGIDVVRAIRNTTKTDIDEAPAPGDTGERPLKAKPVTPPTAKKPSNVIKYLNRGLLVLAAMTMSLLLVVNYVFFDEFIGWAMHKAGQKSGVEISYTKVEGNLFLADIKFTDLHAIRMNDPYMNFDIKVEFIDIDINPLSAIFSEVQLNHVLLHDVSGTVNQIAKKPGHKPRKHIKIHELDSHKIKMVYNNSVNPQHPLVIDMDFDGWRTESVRSEYVIYDLLFNSTAHGKINGSEIDITNDTDGVRQATQWQIKDVQIERAKSILDGPFEFVESGRMDVVVNNERNLQQTSGLELNWTLSFTDLQAKVPDDYTGLKQVLALKMVNYLNSKARDFELDFPLQVHESDFKSESSLLESGLWKRVSPVMLTALAEKVRPMTKEQVKDKVNSKVKQGLNRLKRYMDKRDKSNDDSDSGKINE